MKVEEFVSLLDDVHCKLFDASDGAAHCSSSASGGRHTDVSLASLHHILEEAEGIWHSAVRHEGLFVFGELREHPILEELERQLPQTTGTSCFGEVSWSEEKRRLDALINLLDLFCYGDMSWLVCECGKSTVDSDKAGDDGESSLRPYRMIKTERKMSRRRSSNLDGGGRSDVVMLDAQEIFKLEILSIVGRVSVCAVLPFSTAEAALQWHPTNDLCIPRSVDDAEPRVVPANNNAEGGGEAGSSRLGVSSASSNWCVRRAGYRRCDGSTCCGRPSSGYVRDRLLECLDRDVVRGTISERRKCLEVRDCLARDVSEDDILLETQQLEEFWADIGEVLSDVRSAMDITTQQRQQHGRHFVHEKRARIATEQ
eukprot:GHVS01071449.1.p1 GENE.GHVS01071449.1~~GHVS01071449.1.p1  ORF type:complete len:370 (+),score=77.95 GHVS01071449.1:216-1325(+)